MNSLNILSPKPRDTNKTRSVSSIEFSINGPTAFEQAVALSARWMRGINQAIPREAIKGAEFEVGGGGDHPARSLTLEYPEGRIWSSTIDNPDNTAIGRTWVTEITIVQHKKETYFGTRLLNVTRRSDDPFVPSVPKVVRNIISKLNCTKGSARILAKPTYISDEGEIEWLIALIEDPSRKIPIIAMAEAVSRNALLNLDKLADRLCGAAHIVGIKANQEVKFRKYTGRDFAVFDGSIRIFNTDFSIDEADRYSHPLWIPTPDRSPEQAQNEIILRVLAQSINKGATDYPRFQAVRQAAAAAALNSKRISGNDSEIISLYEEENENLRTQIDLLRDEYNQWLTDTDAERGALERNNEQLKSDIYRYKIQNEALRRKIQSNNGITGKNDLNNIENIQEWAYENLSDRIWIAPKAIKEAEKNTLYRNPSEIGEALYILDDLYSLMKAENKDGMREQLDSKLTEMGMSISSCFSIQGDIKQFPSYSVLYKGEKIWCDLHLKRGGGTDPRSMFRIYFSWHEEDKVIIIGHLPTHLDNNLTN